MKRLFTSESVTEGHPDKVCDQIADAVLDTLIEQDAMSRVACETAVTTGLVLVMGEITTQGYADIAAVARRVINDIGYDDAKLGFSAKSCAVMLSIDEQSPDIAMGVNNPFEARSGEKGFDAGAGDQGLMFGFACNETDALMPMPIHLSHLLAKRLADCRKSGLLPYLRPDGKSQVTVEYDGNRAVRVDTVVISAQHDPDVEQEKIQSDIIQHVVKEVIPQNMLSNTKYYVNPTGRFVTGGPAADTGLTGRKIIVDTYGGYASHGGGSFSGKDPSKVDRSAAYYARYAAKNVVAAGLADKCQIELAYAIGVARPVSILVDTYGTGKIDDAAITGLLSRAFDFRPQAMIEELNLRRPIYLQTAAYGHLGRMDIDLPWERVDRAALLKKGV
ncbi:MAG: methionine adenosyltransferase [Christensenellales bacterium]|jgi:S-adenosylmethionine synthetase